MAKPTGLQRLLGRMEQESLASKPISETADAIVGIAGEELEKLRADENFMRLQSRVNELYTLCRNGRRQDEIQWYKNIDMFQGRQFTEWHRTDQRMVESAKLPFVPRIAINICEPIARTEMAKTGAANPMATVSPASNDMEDILAAQAGEAVWNWVYQTEKFQQRVFVTSNWWRTITGMGFVKTYYDTSTVDPAAKAAAERTVRVDQMAQQKQLEQAGIPGLMAPTPTPAVIQPGKIAIDAVTPFNLLVPDMAEVDLQRQPYVLHAYTRPVEQARLLYGDSLPEGDSLSTVTSSEIINLSHLGVRGGNPAKDDAVLIIEAWIKPGFLKELPQGGLVIIASGRIVQLHDNGIPYAHGEFPFAMLTGIESGRFYRKSIIESITPLQNELNLTYAQIIKRKNIASNPQFFYQEHSLDPRRITSRPGLYIPVKLGMQMPQAVPITEVPAYVHDLIDRIRGHLEDISGQHQVSRAISPGADTAASALALLQETDDNFLSTTFDSIESAMETIGRHSIALAVQYWDDARLIRVTGAAGAFDTKMLKGADLASGTDLRIEAGTGLPISKSAKIATVTEWIEKGIIPPEIGLEVMEMGTLGRFYQRLKLDRNHAERENVEMAAIDPMELQQFQQQQQMAMQQFQGQAAAAGVDPAAMEQTMAAQPMPSFYPVGWMDNDEVHIQVHKDYAKSQAYKALPPELQGVFEAHVAEHEMRLAKQMMMQAQVDAGNQEGAPEDPAGDPGTEQPAAA